MKYGNLKERLRYVRDMLTSLKDSKACHILKRVNYLLLYIAGFVDMICIDLPRMIQIVLNINSFRWMLVDDSSDP